jgi:hypothetical protein
MPPQIHYPLMLEPTTIPRLHQHLTEAWHEPAPQTQPATEDPLAALITAQHRENFDLWHEEDKARDPTASDADIAQVKHAIDRLNQRRNDLVEKIDLWLLSNLPPQNPEAPLNSETPGLMVDRLSILALRIFHTHLEAHRESASEAHRLRNATRLTLLEEQRNDLAASLEALLSEVQSGSRRFKLYRQMKMYNDPNLNPAVYKNLGS